MSASSSPPYTFFVGLDVAARSATLAWRTATSRPGPAQTFAQTPAGHQQVLKVLQAAGAVPAATLVVMEATSTYWLAWATVLREAGYGVSVLNPRQSHHFAQAHLQHDKTDARDAQTLSDLAAQHQPPLWTPAPAIYAELDQRLRERESLLDLRQQERNRLHALLQQPHVVAAVQHRLEGRIQHFTEQIAQIERELADLLEQDPDWRQSTTWLFSIPGLGLITAAWLICATQNFTTCQSAEQVAAYAGLVPRACQSGTSLRKRARIGHQGHAVLRRVLYMASLSASRFCPPVKALYDRLRAREKPMKLARCAAARKLVILAWTLVKKGQAFDPSYPLHLQEA
jgi:transposase